MVSCATFTSRSCPPPPSAVTATLPFLASRLSVPASTLRSASATRPFSAPMVAPAAPTAFALGEYHVHGKPCWYAGQGRKRVGWPAQPSGMSGCSRCDCAPVRRMDGNGNRGQGSTDRLAASCGRVWRNLLTVCGRFRARMDGIFGPSDTLLPPNHMHLLTCTCAFSFSPVSSALSSLRRPRSSRGFCSRRPLVPRPSKRTYPRLPLGSVASVCFPLPPLPPGSSFHIRRFLKRAMGNDPTFALASSAGRGRAGYAGVPLSACLSHVCARGLRRASFHAIPTTLCMNISNTQHAS